jgi:hypothetical protein
MLVQLDEPELLIRALKAIANERRGKSWKIVAAWAGHTEDALKVANEPPRANRPEP